MSSARLALVLIAVFFFLLTAWVIVKVILALANGEIKDGGGRTRVRTVSRWANPIQFWTEICLHCAVAVFFVFMGLMFLRP